LNGFGQIEEVPLHRLPPDRFIGVDDGGLRLDPQFQTRRDLGT